jgi:large subunit ribosomal protein L9
MKVILMSDVPALGRRGDLKEVATGYARNYLLPRSLAVAATPANLANVEALKRQREKEDARSLKDAQATAARIGELAYQVTVRASDDGRLFGSVTSQDIVDYLGRNKVTVEKRRILLADPIKALGEYRVPIRLHPEITAELPVAVARA